jgi:tetratricopeptide (TPR) repeat protein
MRQTAIVIAVLAVSVWSFAQGNDKPAGQNAPAGQTPAAAAGQTAAAPQGKRMPQAKTQDEFAAYNTDRQIADPAALEKAADEFATKFPNSELRVVLYKLAMQKYQQANNGDKMIEMARKALSYDADDPEALLGVAQVLGEQLHDTDLDKDQKIAEAKKDAERALVTIDTDIPTVGYPAEQLAAFKNYLRSEAYVVLGTLSFKVNDWADAETNLRKSIDVFPQQPDTVAVFRLAVALDMQNKIPEAMKYADQAVDLTKDHPDSGVGKAARAEKDRLTKLNSGTPPGQAPAPQKN